MISNQDNLKKQNAYLITRDLTWLYLKRIWKSFWVWLWAGSLIALTFFILMSTAHRPRPNGNTEWMMAPFLNKVAHRMSKVEEGPSTPKTRAEDARKKQLQKRSGHEDYASLKNFLGLKFLRAKPEKIQTKVIHLQGPLDPTARKWLIEQGVEIQQWKTNEQPHNSKAGETSMWIQWNPKTGWLMLGYPYDFIFSPNSFAELYKNFTEANDQVLMVKFNEWLERQPIQKENLNLQRSYNDIFIEDTTPILQALSKALPFFILGLFSIFSLLGGLSWDSLRREGALEPLAMTPASTGCILLAKGLAPALSTAAILLTLAVTSTVAAAAFGWQLSNLLWSLPFVGFSIILGSVQWLLFEQNLFNHRFGRIFLGPLTGGAQMLWGATRSFGFYKVITTTEHQGVSILLYIVIWLMAAALFWSLGVWRIGNRKRLAFKAL